MIGSKFERLFVSEIVGRYKNGDAIYLCVCDCGNKTKVISSNLRNGNTKSCGCLQKQKSKEFWTQFNLKHGMYGSKVYNTWKGVVDRTTKPKDSHYPRYGGAGIGIFPDWLEFIKFYEYMGDPPTKDHSIDRIDNQKGYFPGNVRWATKKEQALNRKTTKFVVIDGQKMCISDAAKYLGISKSTAGKKYKRGEFERI